MIKSCRNCKHWGKIKAGDDSSEYQECEGIQHVVYDMEREDGKDASLVTREPCESSLSRCVPALITQSGFSCNLHEVKEK
jgi:hypothetical protein